jgi:hypothetical protein
MYRAVSVSSGLGVSRPRIESCAMTPNCMRRFSSVIRSAAPAASASARAAIWPHAVDAKTNMAVATIGGILFRSLVSIEYGPFSKACGWPGGPSFTRRQGAR